MSKNTINTIIKVFIIFPLLYGSYYLCYFYTAPAFNTYDIETILLHRIFHCMMFFVMGIVLKFDVQLILGIKNHAIKLNFVKFCPFVISVVVLWLVRYVVLFYIPFFVFLLAGYFLIDSIDYKKISLKQYFIYSINNYPKTINLLFFNITHSYYL